MEKLSPIAPVQRVAVTIDVPFHWADHHFQGRAVLPAVEAMELLAHRVRCIRTDLDVRCIKKAEFVRFLGLPSVGGHIEAWCEMEELADGGLRASLLTKAPSKSALMTRTKVHAELSFYPAAELPAPADLDLASALDGVCFSVDPELIYKELVPFGPAFQTIREPLRLTHEGALAVIRAPEPTDGRTDLLLGSPFVLDGSFHAACVWSQRFAGIVAFPVGIGQRLIAAPTKPGETYVSRIFPVRNESGLLFFDIWILDGQGRLFEKLEGVRMRDVSGGKVLPPEWVRARDPGLLMRIAGHSAALAMIDRSTVMPFSDRCLSEHECRRTAKMGKKRLVDFISARLACKRLSRQLSGNDCSTPAQEIVTVSEDGIRPCCPVTNGHKYYCSVSHDRRFTVAVAGEKPIGIDVEMLDERVLKSRHLFMDEGEQETVSRSALGPVHAALRVWTVKEAVAKMLNIHLADAWARTHLLTIEADQSSARIEDGPAVTVIHQTVEDHLITLVCAVG